MRWPDFIKERVIYQSLWEQLKNEYTGEMRTFLNRSYLVVGYDSGQVPFDADIFSITKDNPDFFVDDGSSQTYLSLVDRYRRIEKDFNSKEREKISKSIKDFNVDDLSLVAHRIEVRFPTVHMDHIQQLKQSKYCDQERSSMSKASIRVILKQPEKGYL